MDSTSTKRTFIYLSIAMGLMLLFSAQAIRAQTTFPAQFDLNSLDGSNGFVLRGTNQFGKFTTGVGDVNGDGIDDFAIRRTAVEKGEIIFGRTGGYPSLATLQSLEKKEKIAGAQSGGDITTPGPLTADITVGDTSGQSSDTGSQIRTIADVNGDGHRDLAVTQPFASGGGRTAIIYGSAAGSPGSMFPASVDLDNMTDAEGLFIDSFGTSGDINIVSDDDSFLLFIGVENGLSAVPVFYLDRSTFSPGNPPPAGVTDASMWGTPGSPGGKIIGGDSTAIFGHAIDVGPAATSFTGNGKSVLAIGAPADTRFTSTDPGHIYFIFDIGTTLTAGSTFDVTTLNGTNGFTFEGNASGDELGFDVEFVRDVNGDGLDDLIFGIPGANADAGKACVLYGGTGPFPSVMHPSDLNGTNGTCIGGFDAGDRAGESVCGIADMDSDGLNEICIGAPNDDPDDGAGGVLTNAGTFSVIDSDCITSSTCRDVTLLDGANGFMAHGVTAGDELGTDCTSPGDVNGDGTADVICGAPFTDSNKGKDYVICGLPPLAVHTLVAQDDVFNITEEFDNFPQGSQTFNLFVDNGDGPDTDSLSHSLEVIQAEEGTSIEGAGVLVPSGNGTPLPLNISNTLSISAMLNLPVPRPIRPDQPKPQIEVDSNGDIKFRAFGEFDTLGPSNSPVIATLGYKVTDNNGLEDTAIVIFNISGVNDLPEGDLIVGGQPVAGATLLAATANINDPEGEKPETFSFTWFDSVGNVLFTSTLPEFNTNSLGDAQRNALLGTSITVRATYIDFGGTTETITSDPFGPFRGPLLTVSKSGFGSGSITTTDGAINCGSVCSNEYTFGDMVTVNAVPQNTAQDETGGIFSPCNTPNIPTCTMTMDDDKTFFATFRLINPTPTTVFSSALPNARSGQSAAAPEKPGLSRPAAAGDPITVFYSAINAGADGAQSCSITIDAAAPVTLSYQPADASNIPVGAPDLPFDMNAGETKFFILSFTPTMNSTGIEVFPNVVCDNANVDPISGVNGVFLTISNVPLPDILSIGAVTTNDGIITIGTANGAGLMSASALNIGVGDTGTPFDGANLTANTAVMTVSADTGTSTLPLVLGVCELDSMSNCIVPPSASVDINVSGQPATMAVFVAATGTIALDAAVNRVFMRFVGADGVTRSITSAAIVAP